jgi:hypothetical protein
MIRAINEIGYKPKMLGGAMVGIQATAIKMQLGPLMNGIVNYETWIPATTMQYPGVMEVVQKYQARAQAEGADPLGYYMPPWAYAYLQVVEQAVNETKSLDDASSPITCALRRSRPWLATSSSTRRASGPTPACSRSSMRTSSRPTSTSSRT